MGLLVLPGGAYGGARPQGFSSTIDESKFPAPGGGGASLAGAMRKEAVPGGGSFQYEFTHCTSSTSSRAWSAREAWDVAGDSSGGAAGALPPRGHLCRRACGLYLHSRVGSAALVTTLTASSWRHQHLSQRPAALRRPLAAPCRPAGLLLMRAAPHTTTQPAASGSGSPPHPLRLPL